jgi:uncharacterized protein (AIM24 family)
MRNLAFFERSLSLSTIVNAQIPWLPFESPLVTCLSGTGRVGIRIDGEPDCIAADPSSPPTEINFDRLAAWSSDTRLGISVEPGYANAISVASAAAVVRSSSLVIAGRGEEDAIGTVGLVQRALRLVVP